MISISDFSNGPLLGPGCDGHGFEMRHSDWTGAFAYL